MQNRENSHDPGLKRKIRVGRNIRQIRLLKGIEVKQLCKELSISTAAYSNIERGITDINLSRLMQLADYFSVTCAHILDDYPVSSNITSLQVEEPRITLSNGQADHSPLALALSMAKEEISFLKEQNTRLLNQFLTRQTGDPDAG